jgi:hypothetical protein
MLSAVVCALGAQWMAASRQPSAPAVNVQALTSKTIPIQPLVLSVQAQVVGRHQQGAVVGLRQTGQRLTSITIPPLMGGIADSWGVSGHSSALR